LIAALRKTGRPSMLNEIVNNVYRVHTLIGSITSIACGDLRDIKQSYKVKMANYI